jgi:hypothetical protein
MSGFDLGATLLSVVKHVLTAVNSGDSKSPQVSGCGSKSPQVSGSGSGCGCQNCGKTPPYVLNGLPASIDTLLNNKIFLNGDLNRNQVESLLSLFADLDDYLHQFILLLTSIKQKLPANGAQDTNKQERMQMVGKLRTLIDKWSARRQGGLLQAYEQFIAMGPVGTMGPVGPVGTGFTGSVNPMEIGFTGSVNPMATGTLGGSQPTPEFMCVSEEGTEIPC